MNPTVQSVLVGIGAIATIIAAVFTAIRSGGRKAKKIDDFLEDWYGEPERPGVPARPGVMERLAMHGADIATIKGELTTNGGKSLKDKVNSTDARLISVERKLNNQQPVTVNVTQTPAVVPPQSDQSG